MNTAKRLGRPCGVAREMCPMNCLIVGCFVLACHTNEWKWGGGGEGGLCRAVLCHNARGWGRAGSSSPCAMDCVLHKHYQHVGEHHHDIPFIIITDLNNLGFQANPTFSDSPTKRTNNKRPFVLHKKKFTLHPVIWCAATKERNDELIHLLKNRLKCTR